MEESGPAPYAQTEKRSRLFFCIGGGVLVFFAFLNMVLWQEVAKGAYTVVSFLDIGQGDAAFVETPQGHQILIDGGPNDKILEKLELLMLPWDKDIDLVILSHPAADHVTGLLSVLKEYKVKNIVWTGVKKDTRVYRQWLNMLEKEKEEGANVLLIQQGARIEFPGTTCRHSFDILFPLEDLSDITVVDDNDTSIVAKGVFCGHSVLFTGDLTKKAEAQLVEEKADLESFILKVGHHGSRTSSSEEFLEAVQPQYAVISAGQDNPYRHPHEDILERFQGYGIQVMRTDELGDIVFKIKPN
ncbi:MAG: ComEC/Rec2 family competence protein [bacterium]|nr:ComEC/Rec2 family competence protein [bacterium]